MQALRVSGVLLTIALLSGFPVLAEDEKPKLVPVAEAAKHVDQTVTAQMTVESSRLLAGRGLGFLNSHKDYKDEHNFTAVLQRDVLDKLKTAGIDDAAAHYQGKKIRVTGKVGVYEGRPQIRVEDPKQLELVK